MPTNSNIETGRSRPAGTPSGEVFRRYWLPIETTANLGSGRGGHPGANNPLRMKILDEHLVSRNARRAPGQQLQAHREAPVVPLRGARRAHLRLHGPPDRQPSFPRYPQLFREDGLRVTGNGARIQKSNVFLQTLDNVLDVWHREILHGWYKGSPRKRAMHHGDDGQPATPMKIERTPWGACYATLQNTNKPGMYEYHETHAVLPCIRYGQAGGSSINWAVPIDDYTTRWFGVSFHPFDELGHIPPEAYARLNNQSPLDSGGPFYEGWAEDVGHWWNLGHPLRQGPIWEDEIAMGTQGSEERHGLPDWERWRLASSDRGVVLMHELWQEQIERVQRGLDPIGVDREAADDFLPIPGEQRHLDWETGMRLFNLSLEERTRLTEQRLARACGRRPS